MEPSIIPDGIAADDRGTTRFANGFDLSDVMLRARGETGRRATLRW